MNIKFANNASTVLIAELDKDSKLVRVSVGAGSIFPLLVEPTDYFRITVVHPSTGNWEIMKVTRVVGDEFTVERAQEGTVALDFPINSLVENRLTAESLEEILRDVQASETSPGRIRVATEEEVIDGRVDDACLTPANSWYLRVIPGVITAFAGTFDAQGFPIDTRTGKPRADWHRCDGTYNTPDLRDKFVMCAGSTFPVNDTAGSITQDIKIEAVPHTLTTDEIPTHKHTPPLYRSPWHGYTDGWGATLYGNPDTIYNTTEVGASKPHNHDMKVTLPERMLPPYYALAYIMKIK